MYGRTGLDRFKKAETLEPFSVTTNSTTKAATQPAATSMFHPQVSYTQNQYLSQHKTLPNAAASDVLPTAVPTQPLTQVGGAQSTWQPPDWAIEPRPGVYYLDVMKDGEALDVINLDKRRNIFGRQFHTCDFVLDHQSVSRQHAAVIPHKNGSVYVIDLGSAHGTFVANERLTKDSPVELEVGQSLKFAASTRTYILRKNNAALFPPPTQPTEIDLPPPPDASDEDAVLAYNTFINRSLNGLRKLDLISKFPGAISSSDPKDGNQIKERPLKRIKRTRVTFKDQVGAELVEIVGYSDGADVETEPGPVGVKEGSLVGKYESLVQTTVIPKGKEQQTSVKESNSHKEGVTEKLQQVLNKVKAAPAKNGGIYEDLYGESSGFNVGSSWAYTSSGSGGREVSPGKSESKLGKNEDDNDDDLFG
ncbi:nuclear inhibitor of protein phosphatase 1-like [Dorcoceras hygrometricum]|uniref:Nuclear inhibitor of protein phosphatase 1-like n=1 Tax=Dorcoceras hygrometricum TaxID=472368 RepID=A0A2Z7CW08_9LAMI|nr:nuclear inhibitor of protein phosphatase 1-like [Dorcoceras hygrometricum]